jgi:hypothetical protein
LQRYTAATGWQPFAPAVAPTRFVDSIAVSPDGTRLAVVTQSRSHGGQFEALVLGVADGAVIARMALGDLQWTGGADWADDNRHVVLRADFRRLLWAPDSHRPATPLQTGADMPIVYQGEVAATRGPVLIADAPGGGLMRLDLAGRAPPVGLTGDQPVAAGFVPDRPVFWAATHDGRVRSWNTRTWAPILTDYQFPGAHFLDVTADGRYDTNLGPDAQAFRWLVADDPLHSLEPQTFMRTFYEPRLAQRLNQCITVSGGCARAFPQRPPPTDLDRVLPVVTIDAVRPGADPGTADVDLSVRESVDPAAPNGQTRSGLYNLRLFRDGALVAEYPAPPPDRFDQGLDDWRQANALVPRPDGAAHAHFHVRLPTTAQGAPVALAAYAFNRDRVKSDTASMTFAPPPVPPAPRRAYVLAIGVNRYAQPRLQLRYSADDAALMAERLAQMPGFEVHPLALVGRDRMVTRAMIVAALDLLAGGDRAADLALLAAGGVDATALAAAGPDDAVIISFSGHGWADAHNNFYLLPADARWDDGAALPDTATLLSSADLSTLLKRVDAGEIALVIDACHSAASVDTVGFKPGPMGDPGLGQLAYDKGVRVLAAAAPGDVAWEDAARKQGLLTFALAREGLDDSGFGQADLNRDGRIMLDEWLRYATARLPALSMEARARQGAGEGHKLGLFTVVSDSQAIPPAPQEPSLFDYTARPSAVAMRRRGL